MSTHIPEASLLRQSIARWMAPKDIVSVSHVDRLWYDAAAGRSVWARKIMAHPRLKHVVETVELESAAQYELVLQTLSDDAVKEHLEGMIDAEDSDAFVQHFALFYGLVTTRYTQHMGVTHFLLRHPSMQDTYTTQKIGDVESMDLPRSVLALGFATQFYERLSGPHPDGQMWLVSFYAWAGTTVTPFHRKMLTPAHRLLSHAKIAIPEAVARRLVDITHNLLHKAYDTNSSAFAELPSGPLQPSDPRYIFGVVARLLQRFPQFTDEVHGTIGAMLHDDELAKAHIECALTRMKAKEEDVAARERQRQERRDHLRKVREEKQRARMAKPAE